MASSNVTVKDPKDPRTPEAEARDAWDRIATGYDDLVTPSHLSLGNEAVTRAGVAKGTRFLDVAAGSGALSIPAARRGAEVLAVDVSAAMLDRLQARAAVEGLQIEVRRMDAHRLQLESDIFDVTGSQFGVMLLPDLPCGLAEMVRVTKPGGKVLVVTFGPPAEIEFFGFFLRAMKSALPEFAGPPSDPPPLPFQIADVAVFRRRMVEAGLKDVSIETTTESLHFESGLRLWSWLLGSNPLATSITSALSPEQVPIVQNAMERLVRERAGGKPVATLTHPIHIGIGTK
jgi:ubiquinone/menaquinone biosynthesis C-methylase UbiE